MISRPPEYPSPIYGSKYSLVVAVAKRARQIVSRRESGVVFAHKPVVIALDEIAQGTVRVVARPERKAEASAEVAPLSQPPTVSEETEEKPPQ